MALPAGSLEQNIELLSRLLVLENHWYAHLDLCPRAEIDRFKRVLALYCVYRMTDQPFFDERWWSQVTRFDFQDLQRENAERPTSHRQSDAQLVAHARQQMLCAQPMLIRVFAMKEDILELVILRMDMFLNEAQRISGTRQIDTLKFLKQTDAYPAVIRGLFPHKAQYDEYCAGPNSLLVQILKYEQSHGISQVPLGLEQVLTRDICQKAADIIYLPTSLSSDPMN